jgi:phage FluMu protein Com
MKFDIKCKDCKRFLGTTDKSAEVELKCSNSKCKALHTYKIVFLSDVVKSHK